MFPLMGEMIKPGLRLLMADDSKDDAFFVQRALLQSGKGTLFKSVRDGREAVDYLSGEGQYGDRQKFFFPNALLLDLKMPGMDGFGVLEWLNEHPDCKVIPTIVFSSSAIESDVHRVYALGGNAYMVKPNNFEDLVGLIKLTFEFWSRCQTPLPPPEKRCG